MPTVTRTILVVDDDQESLNFLTEALRTNYHVLRATNGDDALLIAQRDRPDAILLDVMLPGGKDGFSVFAELQKYAQTRDIPVIMQTDVNRKTGLAFDAEVMGQQLGNAPAAFLQKPIAAKKLLSELGRILAACRT